MKNNYPLNEIKNLHSLGYTNGQISEIIGIEYNKIKHLIINNLKLSSNRKFIPMKYILNELIPCSICLINMEKHLFRFSNEESPAVCDKCERRSRYKDIGENIEKYLHRRYLSIKNRTNEREINIDPEHLLHLYHKQRGLCIYTGEILEFKSYEGLRDNSLSIDRINVDLGYTKGNVVLCSNKANTIKSDLTFDEFKKWMPNWYLRILEQNNE